MYSSVFTIKTQEIFNCQINEDTMGRGSGDLINLLKWFFSIYPTTL